MDGKQEVDIELIYEPMAISSCVSDQMCCYLFLFLTNPFNVFSLLLFILYYLDDRAEPKAPFVKTVNQGIKSGVWQRKYANFRFLYIVMYKTYTHYSSYRCSN